MIMGLFESLFKIGSVVVYQNKINGLKEKVDRAYKAGKLSSDKYRDIQQLIQKLEEQVELMFGDVEEYKKKEAHRVFNEIENLITKKLF